MTAASAAESSLKQALHFHLQTDSVYCTKFVLTFALQSTASAAVPAAKRTGATAAKAAAPVARKVATSTSKAARKTGEVAVTAAGKIAQQAQASLTQAGQVQNKDRQCGMCVHHQLARLVCMGLLKGL